MLGQVKSVVGQAKTTPSGVARSVSASKGADGP